MRKGTGVKRREILARQRHTLQHGGVKRLHAMEPLDETVACRLKISGHQVEKPAVNFIRLQCGALGQFA